MCVIDHTFLSKSVVFCFLRIFCKVKINPTLMKSGQLINKIYKFYECILYVYHLHFQPQLCIVFNKKYVYIYIYIYKYINI